MRKIEQHEIDAWLAKYKEVFRVVIPVSEEIEKVCYLKPPDRKTLSYATSVAAKDPMKFNEILLNGCWIEGDEDIKTDNSLFLAVSPHLTGLLQVKEAHIEKL